MRQSTPWFLTTLASFVISATLGVVPGFAQPTKYDLTSAITEALKSNRELRMARLDVSKSREQVREAYSNVYPNISFGANFTRNLKLPVFFFPSFQFDEATRTLGPGPLQAIRVGADNAYTVQAQVQQILFNPAVTDGIKAAETYIDVTKELGLNTASRVIGGVKKAYFACLFAREQVETMRASVRNAEENKKDVETLYKGGVATEFDFIRADVAVENIRPLLIQAENALLNAQNALKIQMGVDVGKEIEVVGTLDMEPFELPGFESALKRAQESNQELRTLEMQKRLTSQTIKVQTSQYWPTLSAFGGVIDQGQANNLNFQRAMSANVGLNLQLQLFDGFSRDARVEQAKVDYSKVEEQQRMVSESIRMNLVNVLNQMDVVKKRVDAQDRTVKQADRGYQIARTRYQNGVGSQIEISDAELAVRQAKTNRLQAIYDFQVAKVDYDQVVGELTKGVVLE